MVMSYTLAVALTAAPCMVACRLAPPSSRDRTCSASGARACPTLGASSTSKVAAFTCKVSNLTGLTR